MVKTKKLRRLFATLLAVLMLCLSIPSMAFADNDGAEPKIGLPVSIKVERIVDDDQSDLGTVTIYGPWMGSLKKALEDNWATIDAHEGYDFVQYTYKTGRPVGDFDYISFLDETVVAHFTKSEPEMQTVKLNYFDEANNTQAAEIPVDVAAGASTVGIEIVKENMPAGYTLTQEKDTFDIVGGYVYVGVKKVDQPDPAPTTKEIKLQFFDVSKDQWLDDATKYIEIYIDAETVDVELNVMPNMPEGYEMDGNDATLPIDEGAVVTVKVKPISDEPEEPVVGGLTKIKVRYNSTDAGSLEEIAAGYDLLPGQDMPLADSLYGDDTMLQGWTYEGQYIGDRGQVVTFKDLAVLIGDNYDENGEAYMNLNPVYYQNIGLNFYDETTEEQVCEVFVKLPYDAINMNTSEMEEYLPDGYAFVRTGDLEINDGWIYVGVKPTKTLRIFWAIDNGDAADFANGNADMWTQELTWKHINDAITMPDVTVNDGYVLKGWSVSGKAGEFWSPDLETVNLGAKFVEDEKGGIISITANIVTVSTTGGNTGNTGSTGSSCDHDYVWQHSPDEHWQYCNKCGQVISNGAHNFQWKDGYQECTVCGYRVTTTSTAASANNSANNGTAATAAGSTSNAAAATSVNGIPQTSDEMPLGLLAGSTVVAAAAFVALTLLRKRRQQ